MAQFAEKNVCLSAAKALAIMKHHAAPHAAHALAHLMSHIDFELRWECARTLGAIGPDAAEACSEALGKALEEDEFVLVRHQVASSLELLGPRAAPGAAAALAKALYDEDIDVQTAAMRALMAMGPPAAEAAATTLAKVLASGRYEQRARAADALFNMGEAAAHLAGPALIAILRPDGLPWSASFPPPGSDERLRRRAAECIGAMAIETIERHEVKLARALLDQDPLVRRAVAEALQAGGRRRALKGATALSKDAVDSDDDSLKPADEQIIKELLADSGVDLTDPVEHGVQTWLFEDMGVKHAGDIALITEGELVAKGLKEDTARLIAEKAQAAEERRAFLKLLKENRSSDLLKWLTNDMGVFTVAEVALMSEEDLVEDGLLLPATAQQLLAAAKQKAEADAWAKQAAEEAAAEAAAEARSLALQADREAHIAELLAHDEVGMCWCGIDHDELRRVAETAEEQIRQSESEEENQRMKLVIYHDAVVEKRKEMEAAKKEKRKAQRAAADRKMREFNSNLREIQEQAAEEKAAKELAARLAAIRGGSWAKAGKVFSYEEWLGNPDPGRPVEEEDSENEEERKKEAKKVAMDAEKAAMEEKAKATAWRAAKEAAEAEEEAKLKLLAACEAIDIKPEEVAAS